MPWRWHNGCGVVVVVADGGGGDGSGYALNVRLMLLLTMYAAAMVVPLLTMLMEWGKGLTAKKNSSSRTG